MTNIQNERKKAQEAERANKEGEKIAKDRNALQEEANAEQKRSNQAQEKLKRQQNKETKRSNQAEELFKRNQLELQKKTAIGNAIGSAVGGIGTAALLFNDIKWYVKDNHTAESILNLPHADALGTQYPPHIAEALDSGDPDRHFEYSGPSILSMVIAPTIGRCNSLQSAVMRASEILWTRVNERNGRNSAYAAADLMMYQLGLSGLIMLEGYLEKLYDWSIVYSETDNTLPRGMIEAMGMDYQSVKRNRYQLHSAIEDLRAFINAYRLVPDFNIANRWYFAMKTTLTDVGDKGRPQWYSYTPAGFPILDVSGNLTEIRLNSWVGGGQGMTPKHSLEELLTLVENAKATFVTAQDVKIMNSDIISMFGDAATHAFGKDTSYPFKSTISVSTDKEALFQFRNAKTSLEDIAFKDFIITEEFEVVNEETNARVGLIKSTAPGFTGVSSTLSESEIDTLGCIVETGVFDSPAAYLIEASRLIPAQYVDSDEGLQDAFFAEVPISLIITSMNYDIRHNNKLTLNHDVATFNMPWIRQDSMNTQLDVKKIYSRLLADYSFKYSPIHIITLQQGDTVGEIFERQICTSEWENYVWMPTETLVKANNRIALKMLGVIQ